MANSFNYKDNTYKVSFIPSDEEQIEILEHEPHACANTLHERVVLGGGQRAGTKQLHVIDRDAPGVESLETVQAAQHG